MQLRTWFALASVLVAFLAGRASVARLAAARPIAPTAARSAQVVAPCPSRRIAVEPEPEPEPEDPQGTAIEDTETIRDLARIAELEASLGWAGALRGRVVDAQTGVPLAGVTVIAHRGRVTKIVLTDEAGGYEIAPLAPDAYTVSLHYAGAVVTHENVAVTGGRITPFDGDLEVPADPDDIPIGDALHDPDDVEGLFVTGKTSIDNVYVVD